MPVIAVVIASIVLDLLHEVWVEWRRFVWGELALGLWEKRRQLYAKRFVVTEKAKLVRARWSAHR